MDTAGRTDQLDLILDCLKQVAGKFCQQDYPGMVDICFRGTHYFGANHPDNKLPILEGRNKESC